MAKTAVIIVGAGKSERFGVSESKIFAKIDSRPVFLRTVELFINRKDVCQTILVVGQSDMDQVKQKYGPNLGFMGVQVVQGGDHRHESVALAIKALKDEAEYVAVHDAVRPCTTQQMIDDVIADAQKTGAAILANPITATVKRVTSEMVIEQTIPRAELFEAQTPQVFRRDVIEEAYAAMADSTDIQLTDDAQVAELAGHAVSVVPSDSTNIKITTKADISLAKAILKSRPTTKPSSKLGAFEEAEW